jgi:hypothetical protein
VTAAREAWSCAMEIPVRQAAENINQPRRKSP